MWLLLLNVWVSAALCGRRLFTLFEWSTGPLGCVTSIGSRTYVFPIGGTSLSSALVAAAVW